MHRQADHGLGLGLVDGVVGAVDDLKTKGSRRKLPLSPEIANRLLALCGSDADSWIFPASNGAPLNPGNWLRREIRPAHVCN